MGYVDGAHRILITGAAGFIGANFCKQVCKLAQGEFILLDKLTYAGDVQRIDDVLALENVHFVHGDICDPILLSELFQKWQFTHVIHFAAESHVDRSITEPDVFVKTNVIGTVNLLSAAADLWHDEIDDKLFLHVSTDEVFGSLNADEEPFTEEHPYNPNSPYAASKAASDHFVRAWSRTHNLPVIITNCSNNYGPWQFPEKLIPLTIQNALEGRPLPVYGDGLQIRDWIHVEDHCNALLVIMDQGVVGETYLIGANEEHTNFDIVQCICGYVDRQESRNPGETAGLIKYVTDRPGHDRRYAINMSKLSSQIGWRPQKRFEEGLFDYVIWMKEHQSWVRSTQDKSYREYYKKHYGVSL